MVTTTNCLPNTGLGDVMGIVLMVLVTLIAGVSLVLARKSLHRGTTFALLGALVLGGLVLSPTSARASTECETPAPTPSSLSIVFSGKTIGNAVLTQLGTGEVYTICESAVQNCVVVDDTTPVGTAQSMTLTSEPATLTVYFTRSGPPAPWCIFDLYSSAPSASDASTSTGATESILGDVNGFASVSTFTNSDTVYWTTRDTCVG